VLIALTRSVPPSIGRCELTHLRREPIDQARAVLEHAAYEDALRRAGCHVERLTDLPDDPDSVFVEDAAVVFDGVAVVARPGAASRRGEVESVALALEGRRRVVRIQPPGTLDGGDVIVTPRRVFVGVSGRTNAEGARQLATILTPLAIAVVPVPVTACLHLKSAAVWLPGSARRSHILLNPQWVAPAHFQDFDLIETDPSEPAAANALAVNGLVLCAEAHPHTRRRLEALGLRVLAIPAGELAKAEGGVTCCSIVFAVNR
jgi:dimethylargininase